MFEVKLKFAESLPLSSRLRCSSICTTVVRISEPAMDYLGTHEGHVTHQEIGGYVAIQIQPCLAFEHIINLWHWVVLCCVNEVQGKPRAKKTCLHSEFQPD